MAESSHGVVRKRAIPDYNDGSTSQVAINARGDLLVANSMGSRTEVTRLNASWSCQIATASAFTNVATMPTTRAELAIYNGEPSSGLSYVIDSIWFLSLTSITAAANVSVIYQVGFVTALTDAAAHLINSPTGAVYGGRARRAVAVTTMTANKWVVAASSSACAAASIGTGVVANIDGGIILPPGATLGVNAVVGTATGTSLMGVSWHEMKLPE